MTRGAARRRDARPPSRRGRVHLRRGDRAARLARGQARAAAAAGRRSRRSPGLYASPTLINNVQTIATVPIILDLGVAEYAKIGPESSPGTRRLLAVRQRRAARELRAPARDDAARADLRRRRRDPGRPRAEGDHPRRLVGAGVHAATRSTRRSTSTRSGRRARSSARRRSSSSTTGPAWSQLALRVDEVLHARVVRQVHAVPRGDSLDGAACSRRSRTGRAEHADLDLLRNVCDRVDRPVAVRARRLRRLSRSRATSTSTAPSSSAHIDEGGCPFGGESSVEDHGPDRPARHLPLAEGAGMSHVTSARHVPEHCQALAVELR